MSAQYRQLTHHVATRDRLPPAIRPTLLEEAMQDWKHHPRFAGKARFFMNVHRQLLDEADWLSDTARVILDASGDTLQDRISASALASNAQRLLHFAHGHHEIEDHGHFPQFVRLHPQLHDAFSLLANDHQALDAALHGVETEQEALLRSPGRDQLAKLHQHAAPLNKIMHRHITDEEDGVMPIFLRHG